MKALPLDKQFKIMDLLRLRIPQRDIAKQLGVAKSTVQDYKKNGPPFFLRYSKNPSVGSYPASIQEENTWLRQIFQEIVQINNQVINQRNTANRNVEFLQATSSEKDRKIEWLNHLKDENDKTVHQQDETIHELKSRLDQLIKLAQTLVHRDEQRDIDRKKILEDLERNKIDLAKANQLLCFSKDEIHDVTQERDEFKDTVKRMEREHEFDWLKYLSAIILSFSGGVVFDREILPKIKDFLLSLIDESAKNTGYSTNPNQPVSVLRPNVHYMHSGATPEIITSGSFRLGVYADTYEETHAAGYKPIPNPQETLTQPGIYHINSGVPLGINTSGAICCSGAYPLTYGNNTGTDNTVFPNQQDGMIRHDIQGTSGDVTISTYTSGVPYPGVTESTHIISREDVTPIYSPPLITPIPYIPLTPPDNPLDSPLMQQLMLTPGRKFEEHIQGFFIYQGFPTVLTKASHDKGADLIVDHPLGRIVIQTKQWKNHVGIDAINAINGARTVYKATRAIVITTSQFTKEALEHAAILGVECWDGKRLLQELYKHQYFLPPK